MISRREWASWKPGTSQDLSTMKWHLGYYQTNLARAWQPLVQRHVRPYANRKLQAISSPFVSWSAPRIPYYNLAGSANLASITNLRVRRFARTTILVNERTWSPITYRIENSPYTIITQWAIVFLKWSRHEPVDHGHKCWLTDVPFLLPPETNGDVLRTVSSDHGDFWHRARRRNSHWGSNIVSNFATITCWNDIHIVPARPVTTWTVWVFRLQLQRDTHMFLSGNDLLKSPSELRGLINTHRG